MESGLQKGKYARVLEIGAGQGQHLEHVKHDFDEYVETDLRIETLISATLDRTRNKQNRILQEFADAENLDKYPDKSFDRIIVSCVLAHLSNPEKALEEWRRVVVEGGLISIYIPSEPGMLLRLSRTLSTVPKARKQGHDHLAFHYREHVNHFPSMKMLIKHVFFRDKVKVFTYPIPGLSWNFSLWKVFQITKNSELT